MEASAEHAFDLAAFDEGVLVSTILEATTNRAEVHSQPTECFCGSKQLSFLGQCRATAMSSISGDERRRLGVDNSSQLYRCGHCALVFRWPQPDMAALEELYASMDSERWESESAKSFAWQRVWQRLDDRSADSLSILDIGAFTGAFLAGIPESWNRYAIEPSEDARESLGRQGIKVVGRLLEPPPAEYQNAFDVVTLFDVFEHLPHPHQSLDALLQWVRPGGKVVVSTGNFDHWTWKALCGNHWYLDPPQHLCVGGLRFFRRWCEHQGLKIQCCERIPHAQPSLPKRLREMLIVAYFACRQRRSLAAQIGRRVLQSLPGLRTLRHKQFSPYTRSLHDHLLLIAEKTR